jgi:hypothetical protein
MPQKCYSQYQENIAVFERTAWRIPLAFFLKLAQIGSFRTSRHFTNDSGPMSDLIT